ncbi:prion-inhibition and propagation-domain-containing protein [Nemania abortiva]|nr:prion-inhibition and propagation-domain-containing protein [Nemania abortiva]
MEVFGTVASALSVAALFNNCVSCFEYIQLGRHFGRDYELHQLKLDIAQIRLSRWGQAVAVNDDPRFVTLNPQDKDFRKAQLILGAIFKLFGTLEDASEMYKIDAEPEDLELLQIQDMKPPAQKLHRMFSAIANKRKKGTSFLKKAAWALYDGKNFNKLVGELMGLIDGLEKLFPVEAATRAMVEMEIEEIQEDESSLRALQSAATDTDGVLSEVVTARLEKCEQHNYAKNIQSEEKARVRVGNEWTNSCGVRPAGSTRNESDSVAAKGSSAVHIGNSYGGRGVFDG